MTPLWTVMLRYSPFKATYRQMRLSPKVGVLQAQRDWDERMSW